MDCSLLGFSVLGILQARILEWEDIPFSRRSSQLRDRAQVFLSYCRWFLYYLSHLVCFLSTWEEESQVSSAPTALTSSCTDLLLPSLRARNEGQPLLLWSTPQIWPFPFIYPFPLPLLVQLTTLQLSTSSLKLVPSQTAIYPSSSFKWSLMILRILKTHPTSSLHFQPARTIFISLQVSGCLFVASESTMSKAWNTVSPSSALPYVIVWPTPYFLSHTLEDSDFRELPPGNLCWIPETKIGPIHVLWEHFEDVRVGP